MTVNKVTYRVSPRHDGGHDLKDHWFDHGYATEDAMRSAAIELAAKLSAASREPWAIYRRETTPWERIG